jgi:hypothetical protein
MFLIGIVCIIGLLRFLVIFQSEYSVLGSLVSSLRNALMVSFLTALLSRNACYLIISARYLEFSFLDARNLFSLPSYKVSTCYNGSDVWFHLLHFTLVTLAQGTKMSTCRFK